MCMINYHKMTLFEQPRMTCFSVLGQSFTFVFLTVIKTEQNFKRGLKIIVETKSFSTIPFLQNKCHFSLYADIIKESVPSAVSPCIFFHIQVTLNGSNFDLSIFLIARSESPVPIFPLYTCTLQQSKFTLDISNS